MSDLHRHNAPGRWLSLALLCLAMASCSTGEGKADGRVDSTPTTDSGVPDAKLWACATPKAACNAHDTCAIDPICGDDLLCHPQSFQNCSDDLPCTKDICEGAGQCSNVPLASKCALSVKSASGSSEMKCFDQDQTNPADPCMVCDTARSAIAWSPRNGGGCDDGNACTRDDYCQVGVCKGTPFDCSDKIDCTDDVCDGKGGCSHALKANQCLIDSACYKQGDKDPTGCAVCDPSKDTKAWTMVSQSCLIGGKCYASGVKNTGGCGACDPAKDSKGWTLDAGKCFIDSTCYSTGDKNATGCGLCDPSKDTKQWTPPVDVCAINNVCVDKGERSSTGCGICNPTASPNDWSPVTGATATKTDFESGLGGFTVSAATSGVGWQVSTLRPHVGAQSLYYGNPTTKTFDTPGSANSGTATSAAINLPAGQNAALTFWLYMDTETSSYYDTLSVEVSSKQVWIKDSTTMPYGNFKKWIPIAISLGGFAGTSATIVFKFETKDSSSNSMEGVYIDDIAIVTTCGALPQQSPYVMDGKLDASATKVASGTGMMSLYLAFSNDHLYLATDDAGEGNDNFIFLSTTAPGTPVAAPWKKTGTVAFGGKPLFVADENTSTYSGWYKLGDTLIVSNSGPFGFYSVGTGANGGVLEAAINLKEVYGSIPSMIYVAAAPYGNLDGGALLSSAQVPATKNSDGNIDANEILKVSLPGLQVVP
jgi:hypothetical protein